MNNNTVWICCGVLKNEMEYLYIQGKITGELLFLDSMLHMDPPGLDTQLNSLFECTFSEDCKTVVVYGDCSPHMFDITHKPNIRRVAAINCPQMLVGRKRYREFMQEGAFLLLPEWTTRWKEIFKDELGLSSEIAHDLMGENRHSLVYLDTGLVPVPESKLRECAEYTGLPMRIEKITLEPLYTLLMETVPVDNERNSA
jgi:hypothetical protein